MKFLVRSVLLRSIPQSLRAAKNDSVLTKPKRMHSANDYLSPVEYEAAQKAA